MISLISTFSLLCFFTYRFIFWKKYYRRYIGYNQYVVLMYNLALADFIQGLGFIVSLQWISQNSLHATDPACFLQGIWLQIGDPMSGMFVLAIALHTFMHVSLGRQLSHQVFVAIVVGLWVFGVILVIIPIAIYGQYVWMPSVAWVSSLLLQKNSTATNNCDLVLDDNTTSRPPPMDSLLLDLRRPILQPHPLRHHVRPTPPPNRPIQSPRQQLHRKSAPPEPRRLLHGHVPNRLHRADTATLGWPNGIRQREIPQRDLLLCCGRSDDTVRVLRYTAIHTDSEEYRDGVGA